MMKEKAANHRRGDIVNNTYYFAKKLNFQKVAPDENGQKYVTIFQTNIREKKAYYFVDLVPTMLFMLGINKLII